ncbi:transposable element Tcb2 transposase [Trichonephila clavipes]|nr:transposable element Tcb2 transposase [Trichonephila clavipes]
MSLGRYNTGLTTPRHAEYQIINLILGNITPLIKQCPPKFSGEHLVRPPRRNKEKFQQLTEFKRGSIFGLRERGFSYRAIGARVQRNSSTVMRFWKQWTDEHRTTQETGSDEDESRFNLRNHDGRIRARRYAGERYLPEYVIERHSGLKPGVMPEVVPILQGIPGAVFQLDNARPHVAKTVRDLCSTQHMQLLPWPAYSPNMSPIEQVWDLADRRFARDLRPAVSKDELLLRIQAIWNSLPQADIQNLFDSMPRRIAQLIVARGGYTIY